MDELLKFRFDSQEIYVNTFAWQLTVSAFAYQVSWNLIFPDEVIEI